MVGRSRRQVGAGQPDPLSITVLLACTPPLLAQRPTEPAALPEAPTRVWHADRFALRTGIRLAKVWGARVTAVSLGAFEPGGHYLRPDDLGVDAVEWLPDAAAASHVERARALAAASCGSGLILAGDRGPGRGSGAIPVYVAGVLNVACATEVVFVSPGPPGVLLVERALDGGWRETAEIVAPCVLTCGSSA